MRHAKDSKGEWIKAKYCSPCRAMLANQPLHRIAARLRFPLDLKGHGWAANGDWER